ncbi:hypothetical protein CHLRE_16g674534v5 [Chlamydomonas reinhardtii]|uniref:Uncharacterized protein n=1 Tax=Chlamydomonas reinhardtii TaxID=3055 RepID=A8JBD3_CHLRE|nr:uncharacterized protein CHLRE_16g674534v5 [Chlamydomonas reinhardtii]PNW71757.1 hypothetical protein CHLRE_16g674534v5 [Chlamydomonas reinhardtii]|eukprot:XP_001699214.1 predicted protein [Chlamydomonas reinhardtii]
MRTACAPRRPLAVAAVTKLELQVCIHRSCKRQGSENIIKFVNDLGISEVKATTTGCLGNCGNGPNAVLLPAEQLLHHVATPADVAQVLQSLGGASVDGRVLQATQLRLAGNACAGQGDFKQAIELYKRALELQPSSGTHMLYSNMSAALLQAGDKDAALDNAQKAVDTSPRGFHNSTIRLIDCLYALGRYGEAAEACRRAAQADSSFAFRQEYQAIKRALQGAGQKV